MAVRNLVYADETGIHDGALYCFVAGFRGSVTQWKRFNAEWKAILNKPEYRISGTFHSNEFFSRGASYASEKNQYKGWSNEKARRFLGELLMAIRQRKIRVVHGGVSVTAFNARTYEEQCQMVGYAPATSRRQHRGPQPYHMAVRLMVEDALEETAADTELHFVIAEQRNLQQRALDGYALTKELWQTTFPDRVKRLKGMEHGSPEESPGLQAADLLAYLLHSYWTFGAERLSDERRKALVQLTYNRQVLGTVEGGGMEALFADMKPEPTNLQGILDPS